MTKTTFTRTQATMLEAIRAYIPEAETELLAYIDYKQAQLTEKASKSKSKGNPENDAYIDTILEILAEKGEPMTIKALQEANEKLAELSNQKVASLIKKLRDNGQVKRTEIKKVAYFELGSELEATED